MTQPDSIPAEWIEACARALCPPDMRPICFPQKCAPCVECTDEARAAITILRPLIEAETRERCAALVDEFGWILPVLKDRKMNEATDDAACSVQQQIASALRAEGK